jgi:hypothetical protein
MIGGIVIGADAELAEAVQPAEEALDDPPDFPPGPYASKGTRIIGRELIGSRGEA